MYNMSSPLWPEKFNLRLTLQLAGCASPIRRPYWLPTASDHLIIVGQAPFEHLST